MEVTEDPSSAAEAEALQTRLETLSRTSRAQDAWTGRMFFIW